MVADAFWTKIVLQIVAGLATGKAAQIAKEYVDDGIRAAKEQKVTDPEQVIRKTLDTVERKQRWGNLLVRAALGAAGLTRSEVKQRYTEATLKRARQKRLTAPADIVAETIAVVREKQGWDSGAA